MSKTTGKINEIFDQAAITKQLDSVNTGLQSTLKLLEQVAVAGKNVSIGMGKAKDINEQTAAQKALNKTEAEGKRLAAELSEAEKTQAIENERARQALAAKKKELRENVQLEKAAKDSIAATTRLVRELTQAYNQMSASQRKSAAGQELKKQIADTNKLLRDQKMELNDTSKNVGNYTSVWGKARGSLLAASAAITGVVAAGAGLIAFIKSSAKAYMDEEREVKRINFAMDGNAKATERMLRLRQSLKEGSLFSESDITQAIAMATEMGRTEAETRKMIETAMGLSRVTGMDLNSAMMQLAGTYEGTTGRLKKLDGRIGDLTKSQLENGAAVDLLHEKYSKFATEGIDTMEGSVKKLKDSWEDSQESMMTGAVKIMGFIQKIQTLAVKIATFGSLTINKKTGGLSRNGLEDYANWKEQKIAEIQSTKDQTAAMREQLKVLQENNKEKKKTTKTAEETAEEKAAQLRQLEAQKKTLQETLAMRIEMGKATINEMWTSEKASIQDQEAYKLLTEDEKNEYLLIKWREFLAKQFAATKEQADNINALMRSAAGSGFAGTTPGVVVTPTTKKDPNAGITEDIDMSGAEGPTFGTQEQIDKTASELNYSKVSEWLKQQVELYGETYGQMTEIVDGFYANELARIDQKSAKDEAARERELEAAGNNQSKIDAINAKYDKKKKEREKEALKVKQKQAKFDMAVGIMNAIVNTAVSVTGMMANPGGPLGVVLAALAAATGLAQIAVLASTPIPTYAKGRKGGKAEMAVVGEKGKEAILTKEGNAYLTPDQPTFTYLPEGATVVPNNELFDAAGVAALTTRLPVYESSYSMSIEELRGDVRGLHAGFLMLAGVVRDKRENYLNITAAGMSKLARHGAEWERYLNDEIKF